MEKLNFILKSGLSGLLIIAGVFIPCFFIVKNFNHQHPHGLPGILTILIGGIAMIIFVAFVVFFAFFGKQDFKLCLKIASLLGLFLGAAALYIELG